MININLLPEVMRKREQTPMPWLLAIFGMLALLALVGYGITTYTTSIIPGLEQDVERLTRERNDLRTKAEELKRVNDEVARLKQFVDTVRGLYRGRVVWSKVLSDLKHIVNFDPAMSAYNTDMRYIWLTKITGNGKNISMSGYATAGEQVEAMRMPERLLVRFQTYAPATPPEKDEEAKLQVELRAATAEHDALRRENPDLPIQGKRESEIRQRLEEIKNIKSGGIALRSFDSLIVPGSLKLLDATWTGAPQPRGSNTAQRELFPKQAWSYRISLVLK